VVDLTGKAVVRDLNLVGEKTTIDISDLQKGVYMIRVKRADASIRVIRFVK